MFPLFLDLQFFIDFKAFWKGVERLWEGFGEDLGRAWEGLGKVWGGFGEAFGLILDSKMMFGDQSGAGMFKKWLGTFVSSFDLVFLDVGGWGSKATGQNEVGPADRAQRSAAPPQVGAARARFQIKVFAKYLSSPRCSASKA